jgi:ACR3 family arsenite efflux pump ArsB
MTRAALERHQLWLCLAAGAAGLALSGPLAGLAASADLLLWPALALLLLATFAQVPLRRVTRALGDRRFLFVLLAMQFLAVPLVVWGLLGLAPDDPALRLGLALVLLAPCTDWAITFTQLGRGDAAALIVAAPLLLGAQFLLLPGLLWLLLGGEALLPLPAERLLLVLALLVALPLFLAWRIERWAERSARGAATLRALGAWPPVLLALVVFLIALGQGGRAAAAWAWLPALAWIFALYLAAALGLAALAARAARLPAEQARTLAFSLGTRNAFVVLPFALALPPGLEAAALVIVLQSLVELLGMLVFLRLVPRLFSAPDRSAGR